MNTPFKICLTFILIFSGALKALEQKSFFSRQTFDGGVPTTCAPLELDDFVELMALKFAVIAPEGGLKQGFDIEIPYTNEEISIIWQYIQHKNGHKNNAHILIDVEKDSRLSSLLKLVYEGTKSMNQKLGSKGIITEVLTILWIRQLLGDEYFVTGAYSYGTGKQTLGELDLIIGDVKSCKVFLVGEIKSWPSASEAQEAHGQLDRFLDFLKINLNH